MKLLRYGPADEEKPGLLDQEGNIRDLSSVIEDIDGETLSPAALERLSKIKPESLPGVTGEPRLGPCVGKTGKLVCIGLNYSDHAKESGMPIPTEPIVFMKATSAISGPYDNIELIRGSQRIVQSQTDKDFTVLHASKRLQNDSCHSLFREKIPKAVKIGSLLELDLHVGSPAEIDSVIEPLVHQHRNQSAN